MGEYGQVISRAFDNLTFTVGDIGASVGRYVGEAVTSADDAIHQVLPAAIPSWALLVAVVLVAGWFVFRR
jgi:hypothetical protein